MLLVRLVATEIAMSTTNRDRDHRVISGRDCKTEWSRRLLARSGHRT